MWKNAEYIYAFRDFMENVPILDTFHQLHTQVLITNDYYYAMVKTNLESRVFNYIIKIQLI